MPWDLVTTLCIGTVLSIVVIYFITISDKEIENEEEFIRTNREKRAAKEKEKEHDI